MCVMLAQSTPISYHAEGLVKTEVMSTVFYKGNAKKVGSNHTVFEFIVSGAKMTSGGGGNSSLVVPMVMWGPRAPTHCISAIYLMRDQKTLVTGASDGQVILWDVDTTQKISPGMFDVSMNITGALELGW